MSKVYTIIWKLNLEKKLLASTKGPLKAKRPSAIKYKLSNRSNISLLGYELVKNKC